MDLFNLLLIQPLANGLVSVYKLTGGNFGIAIVLFTIVLLLVLRPLTQPYMESMKKMRDMAPDLEKLKAKHKGDSMKFAQAQAELYKQKGINPTAGCLPYILQIVILIAFFNFFTHTFAKDADVKARLNDLMYSPLTFSETDTITTRFLYLDLTYPDSFPVEGLPFAAPGPLLIISAFIQFLSAKMMMPLTKSEEIVAAKTKDQTDDMQVAMQKSMIYMLPFMTIAAGLTLPSGLALYWMTFSVYQMVQQYRSSGWGGLTPYVKKLQLHVGK
jgi:YidC/Oxa1 family membrane protein insertase